MAEQDGRHLPRELVLCNQVLHRRAKVPEQETTAEKRERESRESLLWLKGTEPLPTSEQLVDVCDQGADTLEFSEHEVNRGRRTRPDRTNPDP